MEKIFQANDTKKQAGIAILISDKIDFKLKLIRRNDKGHFIIIKGTINQEYRTIMNKIMHQNLGHWTS